MANIEYKRLSHAIETVRLALNKIIGHINPNTTLTGNRFVRTDSSGNLDTPFGFSNTNPSPVAVIPSFGSQNSVASGDHVHPNTCPDLTPASLDNEIANKGYVDSKHMVYYKQYVDVTVANTASETTLFSSLGSIPANTLKVGDIICLEASGKMSTVNNSQTAQVRLKIDGSDILNSSQLTLSGTALDNDLFINRFTIRVKSIGVAGSIQCFGYTLIHDGTGIQSPGMREIIGSDVAINTTTDLSIDETYQWGSADAGNTITMSVVTIKNVG